MSEVVTRLRKEVVERALHGRGTSKGDARRAAFDNHGVAEPARSLVDKISRNAWKVTDDDVASLQQAGHSDDEIFELAICTSLGQATRQLDSAFAALDAAMANVPAREVKVAK